MGLDNSIINAIKKRRSVRTFNNIEIDEVTYKKISNYIEAKENLIGPFGKKSRFQMISANRNVEKKGQKIGTYGIIKNPKAYIVGVVENDKESIVDFGYVFEKIILYLTQLNIGTCWLGGTFTRNSFEKEINIGSNEVIPCISPIGYNDDRRRMVESAMRFIAKSDNRKEWKDLFYSSDFTNNLGKDEAGRFTTPLEMVRIGPSASNKQPWRIVLSGDKHTCHFYLVYTPNYAGNKMGFDMQRIDIGIAMCHFELACIEANISGNWVIKKPDISVPDKYTEYIVSWATPLDI